MAEVVAGVAAGALIGGQQRLAQAAADLGSEGLAGTVDTIDIDHLHLITEIALGGQGEHFGDQCGIGSLGSTSTISSTGTINRIGGTVSTICRGRCIRERAFEGLNEAVRHRQRRVGHHRQQQALSQRLRRIPAVEAIAVVRHQEAELGIGVGVTDLNRRREAAQQRGHWVRGEPGEDEDLDRLAQLEQACAGRRRFGLALQLQRQLLAIAIEQPECERDVQRLFVRLPRRHRRVLPYLELIGAGHRIIAVRTVELGCAGLVVPTLELGQVDAAGGLHAADEIISRHRLAIETLEVEIGRLAEVLRAEQLGLHPHQLGALLIHRRGVEIVDLDIGIGSHWMRHRA